MTEAAGPDGRHGPHVFVDDLEHPEPSEADRHHLARVLRVRPGDPLTIGDGAGRWCAARFGAPVTVEGPVHAVARPAPPLVVAFALVKGAKPELAVQKLTELGVDEVVVFAAERSVVRWRSEKIDQQLVRLGAVARSAAEQCRRVWLPEVTWCDDLAAVVTRHPGIVRADRGGAAPTPGTAAVAIGPEGGWSEAERSVLGEAVALGEQVLRAETAAITAGALLAALRSGLVAPAG